MSSVMMNHCKHPSLSLFCCFDKLINFSSFFTSFHLALISNRAVKNILCAKYPSAKECQPIKQKTIERYKHSFVEENISHEQRILNLDYISAGWDLSQIYRRLPLIYKIYARSSCHQIIETQSFVRAARNLDIIRHF